MTDNGVKVDAAANEKEKEKLLNTSAYDAITEVLSHGIKYFQKVDEFFKDKVNKKFHYPSTSFCYPTTLLNYVKTGPCHEAYKLRAKILNEISADRSRLSDDPFFTCAHGLLEDLNIEYPFIYQEGYCGQCVIGHCGANIRSLNLFELSRDNSVWKDYTALQARLDRYFANKKKQCNLCKRSCIDYFVEAGPVLCINVELLTNYEEGGTDLQKMYHSGMVRTSLDKLPLRLTVKGSVYVLCGVIERTPDKKNEEHHYVSYCRSPGNKWVKRDGFEGEKIELSELSVDAIALVFYASIGFYDKSERKLLLEPAKSAWNQLTYIELPDLCLEKILDFLDNKELKILIDGIEGEKSEKDVTCSSANTDDDKISIFSLASRSSEYEEQRRRLYNVIIYNLPHADDVSDLNSVKMLFDGIPDVDLDNIQVRRCKKRPGADESPPTIVTFQSHFEAKNIIMSKKSFPKGIKVCRDFTKWQRNRYKKLMAVAEKHNKANPDAQKMVKYIDGIPTLVKKKKNYYRKNKSCLAAKR